MEQKLHCKYAIGCTYCRHTVFCLILLHFCLIITSGRQRTSTQSIFSLLFLPLHRIMPGFEMLSLTNSYSATLYLYLATYQIMLFYIFH